MLAGLAQAPAEAARFLLGKVLVRIRGGRARAARIVETEAYLGAGDPAAHAWSGRTKRTEPLWGPPGTLYVYFVYGRHHCLNLAVDRAGRPGCVLIRAAEPLGGRTRSGDRTLSGPGRLCRALRVDRRLTGRHLFEPGSALFLREGGPPRAIGASPRVGLRVARRRRLRFFDRDSAAVSGSRYGRGRGRQ